MASESAGVPFAFTMAIATEREGLAELHLFKKEPYKDNNAALLFYFEMMFLKPPPGETSYNWNNPEHIFWWSVHYLGYLYNICKFSLQGVAAAYAYGPDDVFHNRISRNAVAYSDSVMKRYKSFCLLYEMLDVIEKYK